MDVPGDVLSKMERFCAFQERCEADVRKKLSSFPCSVAQRDAIVQQLIDNDFLNEQRFVEIFVRSKVKECWGKLKIRQALFAKKVAADLVDSQMATIDEEQYQQNLVSVMDKWKRLNPSDVDNRSKLIRTLLTKGYEMGDILKHI